MPGPAGRIAGRCGTTGGRGAPGITGPRATSAGSGCRGPERICPGWVAVGTGRAAITVPPGRGATGAAGTAGRAGAAGTTGAAGEAGEAGTADTGGVEGAGGADTGDAAGWGGAATVAGGGGGGGGAPTMGRKGPPPPRIGGRNGRLPNAGGGAPSFPSPDVAGESAAAAVREGDEPCCCGCCCEDSGVLFTTGAAVAGDCTVWPEELSTEGEASPEPAAGPVPENAGTVVTGSKPNRFRIALATSSSSELECVFRALSTPRSGSRSIILPGFTSSSRANSLIRIFITQRVNRLLYLS